MVAEVAEGGAFETDRLVQKVVGCLVETEVAEYDLGMLENVRSDTEHSVKAVVPAGSIGVD